jgi:hypothetical protein
MIYKDDGNGRPGDLISSVQFVDRLPAPVFIHEFTVLKLEDMGMNAILQVVDATVYYPGMRHLCLNIKINSRDNVNVVTFDNNKSNELLDIAARTRTIHVPFFRSVLIEFNPLCMQELYLE